VAFCQTRQLLQTLANVSKVLIVISYFDQLFSVALLTLSRAGATLG